MNPNPIKKSYFSNLPPKKIEPKISKAIDTKISKAASPLFNKVVKQEPPLKARVSLIGSNLDSSTDLVETISDKILSSDLAATEISGEAIVSILRAKKFIIAEVHEDKSVVVLKNYHLPNTRKGHKLLLKGKAVLLHEGGAIATSPEMKSRLLNKKVVLHEDSQKHPEVKKLVGLLKKEPLIISHLSSEGLHEFHAHLLLEMATTHVGSVEPHAKTKSENIRKHDPEVSSKKSNSKNKEDPFADTKERLIIIFMNWYHQKMAIEKARIQKAREEEKENQIELDLKDKKRRLEKKEHRTSEDKATLALKNKAQQVQLKKSAAKIDAKSIRRLKR